MKMKSKLLTLVSVLLIAMLMLCGCSMDPSANPSENTPTANVQEEQATEITFVVTGKDGTQKEHKVSTQKETLAEALDEAGLIEFDTSGFYTVIDGVRADYNKDGAYWWIKVNGADATVGMNDIKIEDGGRYEAIYTPA